jgi:tRNA threonylcarbamoyladenosine biosynthesis protein TsaB
MLILAIDSATPVAGVALMEKGNLIKEEFVNYKKTHSESLMPMIDRVLRGCDCGISDLSAVAVTIGPGSFTGLRIGLAAAKGIGLASARPLLGINTLDALAYNIIGSDALLCPLLDARKQELYTAIYDGSYSCPLALTESLACSPKKFVDTALEVAAEQGKDSFILLGNGYYPYKDFFHEALGDSMTIAAEHLMLPRAAAVASLGMRKLEKGEIQDAFQIRPFYIRLSEAEYRLGKGVF